MSSAASVWQGQSGVIPVVNTAGNLFVENQIATAGQKIFILASFQYTPGTNSIFVFKNGALLRLATAYAETDSTHITLVAGANVGDTLTFVAFSVSQVTPTFYQNGVPPAGTTGQLLAKNSNNDFDLTWISLASLPVLTDGPRTNIASASTVDLTGVATTTRNILITGGLEIDGFLVGSGEVFFVKFQAALVLKNNAAITTGTGADIGVSPNDTCLLRATGANTVEVLVYCPWFSPNGAKRQDFRLTVAQGNPVPNFDLIGVNTLYLTPYVGNQISLYNGKGWETLSSAEVSLNIAAITGTILPYDVYCYNNAGVPTLEVVAWTNDTARAVALSVQGGVYVKGTDSTRRYLGTIRNTAAGTLEDSSRRRFIWNYYNRCQRDLYRFESANSWTYTAAAVRQANANPLNQVEFVLGVAEDLPNVTLLVTAGNSAASTVGATLGLDSTSSSANATSGTQAVNAGGTVQLTSRLLRCTTPGYHYVSWNETSQATGVTTWTGSGALIGMTITSGISGNIRC